MRTFSFPNVLMAISMLLLIGFGAPRFLASVWIASGDPIFRDIGMGVAVSQDDLNTLIESREVALGLVDMPRAATDLGIAYVAGSATPENLEKAIASLKAGIEMAPVAPFAWQRLASLQSMNTDNHVEAIAAWETARKLAEHEPFLLHDRIRIGILLYRSMTEDQREILRMDAETAYKNNKRSFRSYGRDQNLLEWFKFLLRDEEKTEFLSS